MVELEIEHRRIIRTAVWSAAGVGAVLGPGIDAAPLLAIWSVGYVSILRSASVEASEEQTKAALAGLFAGAAQWIISGFIAKAMLAIAASAALAATGIGVIGIPAAILGTNSMINALYTYKFLMTTSTVVRDPARIHGAILDHAISLFISEVVNVAGLFSAIAGMIDVMVTG